MDIIHVSNVHKFDNYRVFLREIQTLADNGYSINYISPDDSECKYPNVVFHSVNGEESEFKRAIFVGFRIFKKVIQFHKNSIIHFHSPEWLPYAFLLKLLGRKIIYDVHEDVPRQIYTKVWLSLPFKIVLSSVFVVLEWIALKLFDRIVACEPVTFERFKNDKTILVRNFPLNKEFYAPPPIEKRLNQIVYIGKITRERGIEKLIQAMSHVKTEGVRLVLGGKFTPEVFHNEVSKLNGWQHVKYKGELNRSEVVNELHNSKIGLLVLNPIRKYRESYPVKLFEYLAAGVPVLMSNFQHWIDSIGKNEVAQTVDKIDPIEIALLIDSMLADTQRLQEFSENGYMAFKNDYRWDKEGEKLIQLYIELLNG